MTQTQRGVQDNNTTVHFVKPSMNCHQVRQFNFELCVISGFRCEVAENCTLLGCYAVCSGIFFPTFRDNL